MLRLVPLVLLLWYQDPDVDALLKQLSDDSIEVREKATAALVERGEKVHERLKREVVTAEGDVKGRLTGILRAIDRNLKVLSLVPPVRRVTIDAKDANLKDVLADLQKQSGLSMDLESVASALVTVKVKEALPWEALDAVCKAAGLGYASVDAKIKFNAGKYSKAPRGFIRHYLVEFGTLDLSGDPSLSVFWTPELKPGVASIGLKSATDDQGRPLVVDAAPGKHDSAVTYSFKRGGCYRMFPLEFPKSDAKSIASLKGTVTLKFPLEEKLLVFESPVGKDAQVKEHEGLSVELQECTCSGGRARVKIRLDWKPGGPPGGPPPASSGVHFRLRLEDGSVVSDVESTVKSNGLTTELWNLRYKGVSSKVIAVEVVTETIYVTDTFDFELKDIPLPK